MNTKIKFKYLFGFFLLNIFIFSSCQKSINQFFQEQFPETNSLSGDIIIDGQVAAPILNTYFQLSNFLPNAKDSSLWIEVDADKLIHFRMYYKDLFALSPNQISIGVIPFTTFPADSLTINTDSNSLILFNSMLDGHLFFNNPKITFIFYNQIPVNLFIRFDSLNFISDTGIEQMGQTVKHIILKGGDAGSSVTESRIVIDKNSEGLSNFSNVFTPIPNSFNLKLTIGNNTDTAYSGDGSETLSMDLDLDLTTDLRMEDIVLEDTINFSLDTSDSPIDALTLKIFFDNEFPFSGKTQIFFTDTNALGQADQIILKIFDNDGWEFKAGVTNTDGETISSTLSNVTVKLTADQLDSLKQLHSSKLIISSSLNTYNTTSGQFVKIFSFYKLGIKIGAKVDYSLNINQ